MKNNNFFAGFLSLSLFLSSIAFPLLADEVFIEKDGFKYRSDYVIADGKTEESETFLILHGTLAHNRMEIVSYMSKLLNDAGFNTLAVNLSLGVSDRPSNFYDCSVPHRHLHEDAVKELSTWTDWLIKKGAKRIIAAGHSRGGNQMSLFMEQAPDVISHYVLFAPATWSKNKPDTTFGGKLGKMLEEATKKIKAGKSKELFKNNPFIYCEDASFTAEAFVSYYADNNLRNTPEVIAKSDKKVLVIIGGQDEVVEDLDEMMKKHVPESKKNISTLTIDSADHFFRDLNMDDAVDYMLEFIEE